MLEEWGELVGEDSLLFQQNCAGKFLLFQLHFFLIIVLDKLYLFVLK